MTLEEKKNHLMGLKYDITEMSDYDVEVNYNRVIGMKINNPVDTFGRHPNSDEFQNGEKDLSTDD